MKFRFRILLRFLFTFEIHNKMISPFFVSTKCNLAAKELAEKNTLLACTLLIYNTLLGCMWVLGNNSFAPVIRKLFNYVKVVGTHCLLLIHCTHSLKEM